MTPLTSQLDPQATAVERPIETAKFTPSLGHPRLYSESELEIEEHYTDTHGYTEINFAAFAVLGRQFSPRIRGVHRQRIYWVDKTRNYGALDSLVSGAEGLVKLERIAEQWDQMGRFYASLKSGHTTASVALR